MAAFPARLDNDTGYMIAGVGGVLLPPSPSAGTGQIVERFRKERRRVHNI